MINIFDIGKYKKCREKQYKSYFCLPEIGSYVINKLDKTEEWIKLGQRSFITKDNMNKLKNNNVKVFEFIQNNGMIVGNDVFVLSGVVNELKLISFNNLINQFVYSDGSPITKESIIKLMGKHRFFDWVGIRSKRNLNALAYHIDNKYSDKIEINNKIYGINIPGIDHGKGDFIVCYLDNFGQPLQNTLTVYNGIEFKEKFDNRGWQNVISTRDIEIKTPDSIIRHLSNGNSVNKVNDFRSSQLIQVIEQILSWCKKTVHQDIKWEYKRLDNIFTVASSVVESYRKLNDCTHVVSTIEIKNQEIEFKQYNIKGASKKKALEFSLPIDANIADRLVEDRFIYFGILGYIRGDATSLFKLNNRLSKSEYDGLERYSISSSGINRVCRGLDKDYELSGEVRGDLIRSILQLDRALEKSHIANELVLFRGMPLDDAYVYGKCDESSLSTAIIPNTAFTSTSLNLHATLMFALPNNKKEGLIQIIDNNIGINGMYINSIAGWEEQYEVLIDRCYDIQNDRIIMEIKVGNGAILKVVKSHFVMHKPFSNINSVMLANKGIFTYDEFCKVNFYKELFDNETHEIFDIIREKGIINAQYIKKTVLAGIDYIDRTASSYIVIDAGDSGEDNKKGIDILYRIDKGAIGGNTISIYELHGDKSALRNYWKDINRNNGKVDYNYKWSTYNYDKINIGDIDLVNIDYVNINDELSIEDIADMIYKDIIYRKDAIAFPLLDIARYFGQIFQQCVIKEGYVIKQGFRIDRIGKEDNPQDGYVPIKFRIDGDNDDDLLLQIMFKRDNKNNLSISYRGQAESRKVNETKTYCYNTFNTDVANKVAEQILYTFAKKLELSCVGKIDRLIENYCIKNGFSNIRIQQNTERDRNGSHCKKYRIIKVPEAYNMLGVKILGGEFKLMISNKVAKEIMMFNHQSSIREIREMLNATLKKLKDESSFNDLVNMNLDTITKSDYSNSDIISEVVGNE